MKVLSSTKTFAVAFALALAAGHISQIRAQQHGGRGLPPEAREQIQVLFESHDRIRREVSLRPDGYTATTESDDPKVAAALKSHTRQMGLRLESGLSVRRWDPAFAEYCDHYGELKHEFTATEKGVSMIVTGTNPRAIKIAQNHAKVVSAFALNGWSEHGKEHTIAPR